MKTTKKSFVEKTAKPCDVAYRLRRASEVAADLNTFVLSIDPVVFPEEHAMMMEALGAFGEAQIGRAHV